MILAAYTYQSGLRAPALIAVVKDAIIYVTVIAAVVVIPLKLGGYGADLRRGAAAEAHPRRRRRAEPRAVQRVPDARARVGAGALSLSALDDGRPQLERPGRHPAQHGDAPGVLVPARASSRCSGTWRSRRASTRTPPTPRASSSTARTSRCPRSSSTRSRRGSSASRSPRSPSARSCPRRSCRSPRRTSSRATSTASTSGRSARARRRRRSRSSSSLVVKFGALAFIVFMPQKYRHPAAAPRRRLDPADVPAIVARPLHALAAPLGAARGVGGGHGHRARGWRATLEFKGDGLPAAPRARSRSPGYAALWALIVNLAVAVVASVALRAAGAPEGADATRPEDYEPA